MILQREPAASLPSLHFGARSAAVLGVAVLWGLVEFAALCRSRWMLRQGRKPVPASARRNVAG
jgi:hypothetical protein